MKQMFAVAAGLALAVLVLPTRASELGSNALELGWMRNPDGLAGPVASATAEIGDAGWFASAGHGRARTEQADSRSAFASLGYAYGIAPRTDLVAEAGSQRASDASGSVDSRFASIGVSRAVFGERAIASVRANPCFGGDLASTDTMAAVGIDLLVTARWSVIAEVERADAGTVSLLALHYNY